MKKRMKNKYKIEICIMREKEADIKKNNNN